MFLRFVYFVAGGAATAAGVVIAPKLLATKIPQLQQSSSDVKCVNRQLGSSNYKHEPFFATGDTLFAFASNNGFNFICGTPTPEKLSATADQATILMQNFVSRTTFVYQRMSKLQKLPYYHTFTPHEDEYVAYADSDTGKPTWQLNLNPSRNAQAPEYLSLKRWLQENVLLTEASLKTTVVVFGPGASYFARTAHTCTWHDLPQRLEKIILEKREDCSSSNGSGSDDETKTADNLSWIPRIIALGPHGTWVSIWQDGRCASSLPLTNKLASELSNQMSPADTADFENIVLSPHSSNDFFYATKQGRLNWSICANHREDIGLWKMAAAANYYMQLRATKYGQTFKLRQRILGKAVNLTVSPDTDWTEEKLIDHLTPSKWQHLQDLLT